MIQRSHHGMSWDADSSNALRVLEAFSQSAKATFDRTLASRALGEACRAIPGDDPQSWAHRLVEVGSHLNLRVRLAECSLSDALTFAEQGTPIAASIEKQGHASWVLLFEAKNGKVLVSEPETEEESHWVSLRKVRKLLGISSNRESVRWVVGQPAFACEAASSCSAASSGDPHHHMLPLSRFLRLLRPERQDIWAVVVFSMFVGLLALATPIAVEALVNTVAFGRYLQPVIVLSLILFIFLGFAAAIRGLLAYMVEVTQRRLFVRVVEDLAHRLPRVRQSSMDHYYGPELVNRFFDVVTLQKVTANFLLDGISIVLQTVIGMMVLAFYHPFLLGFDVVLLLLIAFLIFGLGIGAIRTAQKESKIKYEVGAWLEELVRHPTAFHLNSGERFALDKADKLAVDYLEARKKHFRILFRQILFTLGLQAVAATALLGLGGWLVIQGELTLGQLVAAELIVANIVGSLVKLNKHIENFYDVMAAVDKLGYLFDLPIESQDRLVHLREGEPATVTARRVEFQYNGKPVISDLDFSLAPGDRLAIVGPPGCGKSTLVDLICGLRTPNTGHIELDGVDLRELRPESLREHVSVCQGIEVFEGTIEENIHLNRPYLSAADVREALITVGLLDEVLKLPDGLNTQLQTGGRPLSTSQALRLSLARAIVGHPRLLVIDGTLDSLHDVTLKEVMTNLTAPGMPWTLLVTTGRLEVANRCTQVLELGSPQAGWIHSLEGYSSQTS